MEHTTPNDLIGLAEACKLLPSPKPGQRLSIPSLRRWIARGRIAGYKVGSLLYVSRADVLELPQRVQVQGQTPRGPTAAEGRREEKFVTETLRRFKVIE